MCQRSGRRSREASKDTMYGYFHNFAFFDHIITLRALCYKWYLKNYSWASSKLEAFDVEKKKEGNPKTYRSSKNWNWSFFHRDQYHNDSRRTNQILLIFVSIESMRIWITINWRKYFFVVTYFVRRLKTVLKNICGSTISYGGFVFQKYRREAIKISSYRVDDISPEFEWVQN